MGQMLIDGSLDALPWVIGWGLAVVAFKTATAPGVGRGAMDWLVDSVGVRGDLRDRLGVPEQLPQVAPPPRSRGAWRLIDGFSADVRNLKAAVAARRGEFAEGVYSFAEDGAEGGPAPVALAHAARGRSGAARAVDVAAVEALDGDDHGEDAPDIGLAVIRLEDVADLDNLWVVGPKGSGKTTVLKRLLELRRGQHWALDPHNEPGKWAGCEVVGGGRNFAAIDRQIDKFITWMDKRYKAMDAGDVSEEQCKAARRTMVGDEWRAIRSALPGTKAVRGGEGQPSAAARLLDILTEGRKAGICVLAASHADTAEAMGVTGEKDILKCFDMIVYLGAMATKKIPSAAMMPRPAVVYDPEHDVWAQLVVTLPARRAAPAQALALDEDAPEPEPVAQVAAPERQRQARAAAAEGSRPAVVSMRAPVADPLLAGLLAGNTGRAPKAQALPAELSALSPERAEKVRQILARQQQPAPSPAPTQDAPPPTAQQSVTVDQPGGGQVIVNVSQVAPNTARAGRPKAPRKGLSAGDRRRRADEYRAVRAVIARNGSANDAQREVGLKREKALAYARQARAELGRDGGSQDAE
jgi:hypothetical protein